MKTKNFKLIFLLGFMTLGLANCGKDSSGSSSSTTTTSTTGYYMSNGYCYTNSGQSVSTSYCTSGYYTSNGYCYQGSTGQVVNSSYCSSSTTTTSGVSSQCVGYYYYVSNYGTQMVYCSGYNCRGYTLYNVMTNQWNYCQ
jgi:hypothetical protein